MAQATPSRGQIMSISKSHPVIICLHILCHVVRRPSRAATRLCAPILWRLSLPSTGRTILPAPTCADFSFVSGRRCDGANHLRSSQSFPCAAAIHLCISQSFSQQPLNQLRSSQSFAQQPVICAAANHLRIRESIAQQTIISAANNR